MLTNTKRISDLAQAFPTQTWMTAAVQSDIRHAADNLHIAIHSWKKGRIVPELGNFLKILDLNNIDPDSSLASGCDLIRPGVIRLQFTTREIDRQTLILEADPF